MNVAMFKNLFTFVKSDDPMVEDDEFILRQNPNITIQVCDYAGGYAVNQLLDNMMYDHGVFSSLKDAAIKAHSLNQ